MYRWQQVKTMRADGFSIKKIARWFIKFLTDEGDLVADLFGGSGTVAQAAEEMGRHWITGDKSLYYLRTAMFRFPDAEVNEPLLHAAGLGGKKVG